MKLAAARAWLACLAGLTTACGGASRSVERPEAPLHGAGGAPSVQNPDPALAADVVTVTATAVSATTGDGTKGELSVSLRVADGFHVMSNQPSQPSYVATRVTVDPGPMSGVSCGEPRYPDGAAFALDGERVAIFDGVVVIHVPCELTSSAAPGTRQIRGIVRYQACTLGRCLLPRSVPFAASMDIPGP